VATGDAMGRLFMTIISAIAELEGSLVVERVKVERVGRSGGQADRKIESGYQSAAGCF
jgi:hypothetical protein